MQNKNYISEDNNLIDVLKAMKYYEDAMHEYLWHNQKQLAASAKIKYKYYKKLHDNGELYEPLF